MPLKVDIVTPERAVFSDTVDFLVVPGIDGELGILPGHTPLFARLGPGALRFKKGEETELYAVSGGFVEVSNDSVSVFAETADLAGEIDLEKARVEAERAREKLKAGPVSDEFDLDKAELELKATLVRLKVSQLASRKGQKPPQH